MKYAEVTSTHERDDKTDKENYNPISIFLNLNKAYERLMYNQIYTHFYTISSEFQCGFQRGFNAQHCLFAVVEKLPKIIAEGGQTGTNLTDFSIPFYSIDKNLLKAKLSACGFEK